MTPTANEPDSRPTGDSTVSDRLKKDLALLMSHKRSDPLVRNPDPRDAEIAKLRSLLGEAADMLYKLGQHKLIEPPEEKLAKRIWQELGVEPKP